MFKVDCLMEPPFVVEGHSAIIPISFRHFGPSSIEIGSSGGDGTLNLGYRLMSQDGGSIAFEDRVRSPGRELSYDEVVELSIFIPRDIIDFSTTYRLVVDLVYENKYWFRDKGSAKSEFLVSFLDKNVENKKQIDSVLELSIETYLAKSYSRIAELEFSEKTLRAESEFYRSRCENLSRLAEMKFESTVILPPPASQLATFLESVDVVRRRDAWLDQVVKSGLTGQVFGLYPHDGKEGKLQILIYGSGGYGDMLYLTPVIRELHHAFQPCTIVVLHENRNVADVFENNPYVSCAISLADSHWRIFVEAAHCFDVFDMLVDVRYAVTYNFPPMSRIPLEFQLRAKYSGAEYQKYIRFSAWPKLNNVFVNLVIQRGLQKLDLIGHTALLPINRFSDLDIFVPEWAMFEWDELAGQSFITVHHGADINMASATKALQTKNCNIDFWRALVKLAKSNDFKVVQLGQMGEALIDGVDFDLRGKTSLAETAAVIKLASVHIDTEGGLVHLARAVQNRSVVMFGPTPVAFFGYPQNCNFGPKLCGNCWWATEDWSKACPRGLPEPECMASHVPSEILAAAKTIAAAESNTWNMVRCEPKELSVTPKEDRDLKLLLSDLDEKAAVVLGTKCALMEALELLVSLKSAATIFVDFSCFALAAEQLGRDLRLLAYSPGNFPAADNSLSAIVALNIDIRNVKGATFCADMARSLQRGGELIVRADNGSEPLEISTWLGHFASACARIPGGRLSRVVSGLSSPAGAVATTLYLTFTAQHAPTILVSAGADSAEADVAAI